MSKETLSVAERAAFTTAVYAHVAAMAVYTVAKDAYKAFKEQPTHDESIKAGYPYGQ